MDPGKEAAVVINICDKPQNAVFVPPEPPSKYSIGHEPLDSMWRVDPMIPDQDIGADGNVSIQRVKFSHHEELASTVCPPTLKAAGLTDDVWTSWTERQWQELKKHKDPWWMELCCGFGVICFPFILPFLCYL